MGHKIEFWGLKKWYQGRNLYLKYDFSMSHGDQNLKIPLNYHGIDTEPDQQTFCVCQVQYYNSTSKIIVMNGRSRILHGPSIIKISI